MHLIDSLRAARETPDTALHEFLSKYNPSLPRVHIFVEGAEDKVFYRFHFQRAVPSDCQVFTYSCGNKDGVYVVHAKIRARQLSAKDVFWCVDKDLSDLMPESFVEDHQIFTTDTYSIENYFVNETAVLHVVTALFRVRGVSLDLDEIIDRYRQAARRFYFHFTSVMAAVVQARRLGQKVNLGNLAAGQLLRFDDRLLIKTMSKRYNHLKSSTGIGCIAWQDIRAAATELRLMAPKKYIRGKFELWFLVAFLKTLRNVLDAEAARSGGDVSWLVPLELSNTIAALTPVLETPHTLSTFLARHYPQQRPL